MPLAEPQILMPPVLSPAAFARRDPGASVHRIGGATMGTTWSAAVAARALPVDLMALIERELCEIVAEMSNWDRDSAISRFNRAPAGSWQMLPSRMFTVLAAALDVAAASDGAFDPTAGALVDLWGFGPAPTPPALPDPVAIAGSLARTGWDRLAIDRPARRARQPGGISLDFCGIAKGYAVDRLAAVLHSAGLHDFLVEIGGELVGAGIRPDGQPWWVDVETPGPGVPAIRIALHDRAVATSGDYRRFRAIGGRVFSHTLDPRLGLPIPQGVSAVTLIAADCMTADAWATALTVLGAKAGLALADRLGLAARFVLGSGDGVIERASSAWLEMLDA